jgi:hypothetical protein
MDDAATRAGAQGIPSVTPLAQIVRDIARGGLAGLIVGFGVLGIGARLVMRLHALIVPAAIGSATENGNRIGEITLGGTVGLLLIAGLFGAIVLGVLWVVLSAWLPGGTVGRGVLAMPVAVGVGAHQLIALGNTDFIVLRHEPLVVITLLMLIAILPLALSIVDAWLERRLPHGGLGSPAGAGYLMFTAVGGLLGLLVVAQAISQDRTRPLGLVIVALGLVTIAWWAQRLAGRPSPGRELVLVGRTIIAAGTIGSAIAVWPAISYALLR